MRPSGQAGALSRPAVCKAFQNPIVRQAVQAGLAVAFSIALGSLISGRRWYWAAIAAFIVGSGVNSRGEALVKGLQRIGGTLGGLLAGMVLASAVAGHTKLALGLVLLCVFVAFYAFQAAYGLMILAITVMLALLYGILGQFQPSLLVLRLEETALGAAISIAVTRFVLPISQHDVFRTAADEFLATLASTVRLALQARRSDAEASGHTLRAKLQALRNAVGTLKRGWGVFTPLEHRLAVRAAMRCSYLTRELVEQEQIAPEEGNCILKTIERLQDASAAPRDAGDRSLDADPWVDGDHDGNQVSAALVDALQQFGSHLR